MSRVKRGVTKHARHKKVIDAAKGYRGRRKNTFRIANQAVEKAGEYAYIGRKLKKRQFRALCGNEPEAFKALVETAKKNASAPHTVKS